jgi:hypothetical protein
MPDSMTVIYTAANVQQAHLLKNLLDEAGIAATVANDALQGAIGEVPLGWATSARVVVSEERAAEARRIAEEFDATIVVAARHEHGADDVAEVARVPDEGLKEKPSRAAAPANRPRCPQCGKPRMAICPVCETAGTDFPLADMSLDDLGGEGSTMLICRTCDEPFEPGYLRRCEWCAYDFGTGIEPPQVAAAPAKEPMNLRVVLVFLLIAGSIVGLLVYFALLV